MSRFDTTDLERRVDRLERLARQPSWLDQPATLDGHPIIMGDTWPIETKIVGGALLALVGLTLALILLAAVGVKLS